MSNEENARSAKRRKIADGIFFVGMFATFVFGLSMVAWDIKRTPPMTCEDYGSYRIENVPARCLRYWTTGEGHDAGADSGENHD